MATVHLPPDFKDFLKLLKSHHVKYLLVGGYAVGYYGYPRATVDMDIWVLRDPQNAKDIVAALQEFGFKVPELSPQIFLKENQIVRMGVPPVRIEIITTASGVDFETCFAERLEIDLDGVGVNLISLKHLKENKKATGRYKDLNDLENLP